MVTEPKHICNISNKRVVKTGHVSRPLNSMAFSGIELVLKVDRFSSTRFCWRNKRNKEKIRWNINKIIKIYFWFCSTTLVSCVNCLFSWRYVPIGTELSCDNYRLVSLNSSLKVFEMAVMSGLCNSLETQHILFIRHGFVRNKSTTLAILSLINDIVRDLDNRQYVTGLFFI